MRSWDKFMLDLGCVLNSMTSVPIGRKDTETEKKAMWWRRQRLEWCSYKLRNTEDCWEPPGAKREARNRFSLRAFDGTNPADTLISGILSCERINFYCFKVPSLWQFVKAAPGNYYTWQAFNGWWALALLLSIKPFFAFWKELTLPLWCSSLPCTSLTLCRGVTCLYIHLWHCTLNPLRKSLWFTFVSVAPSTGPGTWWRLDKNLGFLAPCWHPGPCQPPVSMEYFIIKCRASGTPPPPIPHIWLN